MNRREALALLVAIPFVSTLRAQTRITAQYRVFHSGGHGLLLAPDGTLQSWFARGSEEPQPASELFGLGDARQVYHHTLYPVVGLRDVVSAAIGSAALAVLKDGRVLAWGATGSGQLGITPREEFEAKAQPRLRTNTPTPVAVSFDAIAVSTKSDHVLALARDGSVWAWGLGDSGQLGIGPLPTVTFKSRSARVERFVPYPVRIPDLEGVTAISAGNSHSLALLRDGTVRAWGYNKHGQLGDGTFVNRDRPITVPGVRNVIGIATGWYRSAALLQDGTVMEWGANHINLTPRPNPALVPGVRGARSIVAGGEQVIAIMQSGEVMTWGQNAHYETGRGRETADARLVRGLSDVKFVASGDSTTIVILGSGRMMTWGEVRPWTRPDGGGANLSPYPILLWLDGLEQP